MTRKQKEKKLNKYKKFIEEFLIEYNKVADTKLTLLEMSHYDKRHLNKSFEGVLYSDIVIYEATFKVGENKSTIQLYDDVLEKVINDEEEKEFFAITLLYDTDSYSSAPEKEPWEVRSAWLKYQSKVLENAFRPKAPEVEPEPVKERKPLFVF